MSPNPEQPPPPTSAHEELQFHTAETVDTRPKCGACCAVLASSFYQIQGVNVCAACAEARRAYQELPDSAAKFGKALLYGAGAAALGWAGWSAVEIATGFQIGLLAIGVGWLVGTAIRKGTDGHTSRKYQIMAVVLTYLAISMSFVPILIADLVKKGDPAKQASAKQDAPKEKAAPVVGDDADGPPASLLVSLVLLFGFALASPLLSAFYGFPMGLISLFILYLALQQAWKLTQPDDAVITGPFAAEPAG